MSWRVTDIKWGGHTALKAGKKAIRPVGVEKTVRGVHSSRALLLASLIRSLHVHKLLF